MTIAYLMNTYPMTSSTFIVRELAALERLGVAPQRYALRRWDGPLVEMRDRDEAAKTRYFLSGNAAGLIASALAEIARAPSGAWRAFKLWRALLKRGGGIIRHSAYFLEAAAIKRQARRDGVRHLHAHFGTNAAAVAMLARAMGGPTYSFTVHGPDELHDQSIQSYDLKIDGAAFVAAISHFCRAQLNLFTDAAFADKIEIIGCGLELDQFALSATPQTPSFLCIGRLCHQKGQLMIPPIVARLRDDYPDIIVSLIGDGDLRPDLEAAIERFGVGDSMRLLGWRDGAYVRKAIADHRHVLLPSSAEGLPVVLMEAYAMGRTAVSTFIAGIPELIDDQSGWLVPAGDAGALEAAMRAALATSDADLTKMARIGRERVLRRHDVDKEAEKLISAFRRAGALG